MVRWSASIFIYTMSLTHIESILYALFFQAEMKDKAIALVQSRRIQVDEVCIVAYWHLMVKLCFRSQSSSTFSLCLFLCQSFLFVCFFCHPVAICIHRRCIWQGFPLRMILECCETIHDNAACPSAVHSLFDMSHRIRRK